MKILLTGCSGQLGRQIINSSPKGVNLICLKRENLDLTNLNACFKIIINEKPDWIINAGAYTDVDKSESNKELTIKTNSNAPLAFSEALKITGGKLLQISTDYVFGGNQCSPYNIDQKRSPINFYGFSKSLAEENIVKILGEKGNFLILRTSWVMGPLCKNFLLTMLNLHKNKDLIKVVSDQVGSMTSTISLANACWKSIEKYNNNSFHKKNSSILHFTNRGDTNWYDIAIAVGEIAVKHGLISHAANVHPIKSSEYQTKAKRPNYSVLNCETTYKTLNLNPSYWRDSIEDIIKIIKLNN